MILIWIIWKITSTTSTINLAPGCSSKAKKQHTWLTCLLQHFFIISTINMSNISVQFRGQWHTFIHGVSWGPRKNMTPVLQCLSPTLIGILYSHITLTLVLTVISYMMICFQLKWFLAFSPLEFYPVVSLVCTMKSFINPLPSGAWCLASGGHRDRLCYWFFSWSLDDSVAVV